MNSNVDFDLLYAENEYIADTDAGDPSNAPVTTRQWQAELRRFDSGGTVTCQQWFRTKDGLWLREGSIIVPPVPIFTVWTSWVKVADFSGAGGVTSVNGETGDVVLTVQAVGS